MSKPAARIGDFERGVEHERARITEWLKDRGIIRDGMFSPQFIVAYTDADPIDIPADLGASEQGA
jgi:hypothetical protein